MVVSHLKLIFQYFKLNLQKEYQYKTSFFMQIVMMILNDFFFIIQWAIIFSLVDNICGYGFRETMILWAISAGGFGFSHTFFAGAWNIKDIVYEGKMDVFLTQPKNVLINICASSTNISAIGDMLYAYVVLIIVGAPWWWYLAIIPASIISGLIFVAVYVCYVSLSFWVKRGDAVAHLAEGTILKAGHYPPAIYKGITKVMLFSIIPAFFYTVVPAEALLLKPSLMWVGICIAVMTFWITLAFILFKLGLKKYNSGSLMGGRM